MGQVYRHFKGHEYLVVCVTKSASNPDDKNVNYLPIELAFSGDFGVEPWHRPLSEWFEEVDRPEVSYKGERFVFVRDEHV
jgi:hypothetical protein